MTISWSSGCSDAFRSASDCERPVSRSTAFPMVILMVWATGSIIQRQTPDASASTPWIRRNSSSSGFSDASWRGSSSGGSSDLSSDGRVRSPLKVRQPPVLQRNRTMTASTAWRP